MNKKYRITNLLCCLLRNIRGLLGDKICLNRKMSLSLRIALKNCIEYAFVIFIFLKNKDDEGIFDTVFYE